MNYIGNSGLMNRLRGHEELGYVAFVITPWHAHAFEAALTQVEIQNSNKLNGIIIIKEHSVSKYLLDISRFENMRAEVFYYKNDETILEKGINELKGIFYYFSLKENFSTPFYIFNPNGFRYPIMAMINSVHNKKRKVVAVSIDEGLGIYLMNGKEWFQTCIKEQTSLTGKLAAYLKYCEINLLKESKIKKYGQYINCNLLIKDGQMLCHPNGDMPRRFKTSIDTYSKSIICSIPQVYNKYVLINTQPFDDYSDSAKDLKLEVLKKCVCVLKKDGYQVVIKPHPREREVQVYKNIGAEVLECSDYSQESILAISEKIPSLIIGYYSTTLVTAQLLFGIQTVSIIELLIKTGCVNKKYKTIFNNFHSSFAEIVTFIDDYDELEKILIRK